MSKNWIIAGAIFAGALGGGFATANLIEALKPYQSIVTSGAGFIGAIVAYLVAKANSKPEA